MVALILFLASYDKMYVDANGVYPLLCGENTGHHIYLGIPSYLGQIIPTQAWEKILSQKNSVSDPDLFHFCQPDPDPFHETDAGSKKSAKIMVY